MARWLKVGSVVLGAIVLSTLAINASDLLRGIDGSLPGLAIEGTGPCGAGATLLQFGSHDICVDIYEASPGGDCPVKAIQNELESGQNISSNDCKPASVAGASPWRYVTLTQAQQLCARTGKRLPSNEEWYKAVSGMTGVDRCAIDTNGNQPVPTGSASCVTPSGVYDMIGNVWEWVDEEVIEGQYNNRAMPPSGFVALVDSDGIVIETSESGKAEFGNDYANTNDSGVRGMIRGGFYDSGEDAGLFALNAAAPLDLKTAGIGFRCVKDI